MKIDLKSAAFGLCLGAVLALGIGASVSPTTPSNLNGRFQVAGGAAQFVIVDTVTGQGWVGDFHNTLAMPAATDPFFQPKLQVAAPPLE